MSAKTSACHKLKGGMRPTIGVGEIDDANAAFLDSHQILWRSQLFGHRVCAAYGAIRDFIVHEWREEYEDRLCVYADMLLSEMVRNNCLHLNVALTLQDSYCMRLRPPTGPSVGTVSTGKFANNCQRLLMSARGTGLPLSRSFCVVLPWSWKLKSPAGCKRCLLVF